jgi:hypothetical protein
MPKLNPNQPTSKKDKVLPIKLSSQLYNDLKLVSEETSLPMAVIIREFLQKKVAVKAAKLRQQKNEALNLSEFYEKNAYKGKIYQADKSIDQLLYEDQP